MKKIIILTGLILVLLFSTKIIMDSKDEKYNKLVEDTANRVVEKLKTDSTRQQLTYPIDLESTKAIEKATDTFLYTKIFDLIWKKTFHYFNAFESLDSLDITYGGAAGTVTYDANKNLKIETANASTNYADVLKRFNWQGLMTFSQPSNFKTTIILDSTANVTAYAVINGLGGSYYGFKVYNGNLYGVTSSAGTGSENAVLLGTLANGTAVNIEARYYPRERVSFFVNTVEKNNSTTSLPVPLETVNPQLFNLRVTTGTNATKNMYISYIEYLQRRNVMQ